MPILKSQIRTLIVEDSTDYQRIIQQRLSQLGYSNLEIVGNGGHVLDKAREYQPHLILMDTQLPGMMGYEACKAVREQPWGKRIAILGMSGNFGLDRIWEEAGADGFVHKDYFFNENKEILDQKIQQALLKYI